MIQSVLNLIAINDIFNQLYAPVISKYIRLYFVIENVACSYYCCFFIWYSVPMYRSFRRLLCSAPNSRQFVM